jgi:hypothetical protein
LGAVGHRFIEKLAELLEGVQSCKWNLERFLLFLMVVLQCPRDVKQAWDIKNWLTKRMDAWEKGKFTMLVQDTK